MRLVLIEWADSFGVSPSWEEMTDIQEPDLVVCRSVGWLVVDGETNKVVVPHMHDADEKIGAVLSGCGDMTIPTCAVLSIKDLTDANP